MSGKKKVHPSILHLFSNPLPSSFFFCYLSFPFTASQSFYFLFEKNLSYLFFPNQVPAPLPSPIIIPLPSFFPLPSSHAFPVFVATFASFSANARSCRDCSAALALVLLRKLEGRLDARYRQCETERGKKSINIF